MNSKGKNMVEIIMALNELTWPGVIGLVALCACVVYLAREFF